MLKHYLLALSLPPLLLLGWVAVQHAWRRQFPSTDGDALAGRSECGRCGCASRCDEDPNSKYIDQRESDA